MRYYYFMTTNSNKKKTLLVIDSNSWMHRAFHAIQFDLTAPDGRPTGAVFGYFNILSSTLAKIKPDAVIAAFDAGIPQFRFDALEQYKIQRPPTDPELKQQFPMVEELLRAMSVPVIKIEGYEGDDILGTIARLAAEQGMHTYVASGDKDTYQLVDENTWVVAHGYKSSEVKIMTPEAVEERYGIPPEQVIDYLGLKGDPSDNIPGIPGVGEKTASKLLNEYGSFEEIVAAANRGDIKGKLGERIVNDTKLAEDSRVVATIDRYVPLEIDLEAIKFGSWDKEVMAAAFDELKMKNSFIKLVEFVEGKPSLKVSPAQIDPTEVKPTAPTSFDFDACAYEDALVGECENIGVEVTAGQATLFDSGLHLALADSKTKNTYSGDEALNSLEKVVRNRSFACLDVRSVLSPLYEADTSVEARVDIDEFDSSRVFDVAIAGYVLSPHSPKFELEQLVSQYLESDSGIIDLKVSDDAETLTNRAEAIRKLSAVLQDRLEKEDLLSVFREIEMPLSFVLLKMERQGIALDQSVLERMNEELSGEIDDLRASIIKHAGHDFNVDSPKQLAVVLFEELGLKAGKKTKSGYSTDASVLEGLAPEHAIAADILKYREYTKLRSTYLEALPRAVKGDGRIHTTFRQTVAATGRLASNNPNLQNIPIRTDLGRQVRQAFVPSQPGWKLISADYSQIELRVLAHLSGDEGLIEAFKSGQDFHAATAARIFGVEPGLVDSGLRSRAKAVNFGIIYGQGAHALSIQLGIPFDEARAIIKRYYMTFPRVRTFLDETIEFAKEHGYVKTAFGRIRHIPELSSKQHNIRAFGERTAMNMPMQGSAADLIKIAMIDVDKRLREENFASKMLLQVHDELVFEAPPHEVDRLSKMVEEAMSGVADFKVPLDVSLAIGDNWADAK